MQTEACGDPQDCIQSEALEYREVKGKVSQWDVQYYKNKCLA